MRIGIPKETLPGETRVAASPETVKKLVGQGHSVVVAKGAGTAAARVLLLSHARQGELLQPAFAGQRGEPADRLPGTAAAVDQRYRPAQPVRSPPHPFVHRRVRR